MPEATTSDQPQIRIDGHTQVELGEGVASLQVTHCCDAPARLDIDLALARPGDRGEPTHEVPPSVGLGAWIEVGFGEPVAVVFAGHITALEQIYPAGPPRLRITAFDRFHQWRYTQRTRAFENRSVADIIAQLAQAHGLSARVAAAASEVVRPWAQFNQSDAAFLAQLAAHLGADFFVEDDTLFVQTPTLANDSDLVLEYGQKLATFTAKTDLDMQVGRVCVKGWDANHKSAVEREVAYPQGEMRDCDTGPKTLADGYAPEARVQLSNIAYSHAHAEALARAAYEDRAHQFVKVHGTTAGIPELQIGEWVAVSGLTERLNLSYYVREVRHTFSRQTGYQSEFRAEMACSGEEEERGNVRDSQRDRDERQRGRGYRRGPSFDVIERLRSLIERRRRRRMS